MQETTTIPLASQTYSFDNPLLFLFIITLFGIGLFWILKILQNRQQQNFLELRNELLQTSLEQASKMSLQLHEIQADHLHRLQSSIRDNMIGSTEQLNQTLRATEKALSDQFDKLTGTTQEKLDKISLNVEERLSKGFEQTTQTFQDIITRLALIDDAQKKITTLSENVVSLQDILSDKSSRGAFGEVQLSGLLHNMMPEDNFALQYTLSNGHRVDSILFLPEPTGKVAIDAKFPLENYKKSIDKNLSEIERTQAKQLFKQNVKKHIQDIQSRYIVANETSDGAIMFIPAESVFAEIHGNHPDIVEYSHQCRVWLASPTTMMAILTTARAVLKDAATRSEVHIIQKHLGLLAKDFERFSKRMDQLAKHINQANQDVEQVHSSAKKISSRFHKIEKVEMDFDAVDLSLALEQDVSQD